MRLYLPQKLSIGQTVTLTDHGHHYLSRVLRVRVGDQLSVFNGQGGEFTSRITQCQRRHTLVELTGYCGDDRQSPLPLTLAVGVTKNSAMDWVIQKATELGVHCIQPLWCQYTPLPMAAMTSRVNHWQPIMANACEQCGRNRLPVLKTPLTLTNWLASLPNTPSQRLCLHPQGQTTLAQSSYAMMPLTLLIGPEGGFNLNECQQITASGFDLLQCGPRILRTETAVVALLAYVQGQWGDLC